MIEAPDHLRNMPVGDFRDAVFGAIEDVMRDDPSAIILTNDMGALGLTKIAAFASERVVNVGITEQNMMSVASGLALSGHHVFVYGISSHIIFRALEQIKLDICVQNLPIVLIGVGAGLAYGADGPTHHGTEDIAVMRALPNMTIYNPSDCASAGNSVMQAYREQRPCYIRMDKENLPDLYDGSQYFEAGLAGHGDGGDGVIVATGMTVWSALGAQEVLQARGVRASVIDVFRIKPFNSDRFLDLVCNARWVCVIDEAVDSGGIGEIVAKALCGRDLSFFLNVNLGDQFLLGAAPREWAWQEFGLSGEDVANRILQHLD